MEWKQPKYMFTYDRGISLSSRSICRFRDSCNVELFDNISSVYQYLLDYEHGAPERLLGSE